MTRVAVKKRNDTALAVMLSFIAVLAVGSLIAYAAYNSGGKPRVFRAEKEGFAQRLYSSAMDVDANTGTEADAIYPQTPDLVVEKYNELFELMYGEMIIDDETFKKVLEKQRTLFSDEILNRNSFDIQLKNVKDATEKLYSQNKRCIGTKQDAFVYENGRTNAGIIRVTHYYNGDDPIFWDFRLEKQNGQWKITEYAIVTAG